jgi:hypothetical protein
MTRKDRIECGIGARPISVVCVAAVADNRSPRMVRSLGRDPACVPRTRNLAIFRRAGLAGARYSHSMVPGGLLVTSRVTRLTSRTSFVIRVEICDSTSYGSRVQSAVMASSLDTGRSTIGCP